jgi:hypothetical protein
VNQAKETPALVMGICLHVEIGIKPSSIGEALSVTGFILLVNYSWVRLNTVHPM